MRSAKNKAKGIYELIIETIKNRFTGTMIVEINFSQGGITDWKRTMIDKPSIDLKQGEDI